MAPDGLGTDIAPEIDATPASEPAEIETDTAIETDTPEGGEGEEPAPEDPAAPNATDGPALANGRLSDSVKTMLTELAKTSPKLAKSIKTALFESDAMRRELPGGLKEVAQMREKLEQFGGPEAIAKSHEELQYFNDLDQQFTAGDPRFIQAMIETPEGQQGFMKLAPTMLEKYRELAPEAHDNYIARQQYQGMLDTDLKFSIVRMKDAIDRMPDSPEKAAALEQWNPLASYYNGVLEKANKKVELPKASPTSTAPDERSQLEQERQQFTRQQWNIKSSAAAESLINAELSRLAIARKFTDTQKAAVLELGVGRLKKALANVANFNEVSQRHFAAKNLDGFLKHVTGVYRQQIPGVMKAAADAIQSQKAGGPLKPPVAPPNGVPRPPAGGTTPPAAGFTWVPGVPDKTTVDTGRTTQTMIRNGQAILLTGRRVQWRKT